VRFSMEPEKSSFSGDVFAGNLMVKVDPRPYTESTYVWF